MCDLRKYLLLFAGLILFGTSFGQRGIIFDAAISDILDPNGDGFVSETDAGFSNDGYYPDEFEIRMFGFPTYEDGEVLNDIQSGANCATTDLAADIDGYSVYGVLDDDNNLIFRFRVSGDRPSVESYSILIDTDQLMGVEDPNSTPDNPGFEIVITMIKNKGKGVYVYNIDGIDGCPKPDLSYPYAKNVQRSIAGLTTCDDEDYFYDYYVPFADLASEYGISLDTEIRFAAVTNVSATCAMGGSISDIAGVDNDEFAGCPTCAFLALSAVTCPTSLNNLCIDCEGFLYGFTEKPEITKPLKAGQEFVNGTAEPTASIFIQVYNNLGNLQESDTVQTNSDGYWETMLQSPLTQFDSVTARAKIDGRCRSGLSESDLSFAIVLVNFPPEITGLMDTLVYIENDGAVPIEPTLTLTDPDDSILTRTIVAIINNYISPEDVINFTNQNGISGLFNSRTGLLSLTGVAFVDQYQNALAGITYENTSEDPDPSVRTVRYVVFDSLSHSDTFAINVIPVNDPPVITGSSTSLQYTFGDGSVAVDASILINDLDHDFLSGGMVYLSNNYSSGEDLLTFTDQNGISGVFDPGTGSLTLSGNASITDYITALSSINYSNTSGAPSELTRQVSFSVFDGLDSSNVFNRLIDYTSTNNPPEIIDNNGNPLDTIYIITDEDVPTELCLIVQDPDGDAVSISSVISLNGNTNSIINTDAPLCFDLIPNANYFGSDTIRVIVSDHGIPSLCDTITVIVDILSVNDLPVIVGNTTKLSYTEGDEAVIIDNSITVTDIDHINILGAVIKIANNYVNTEDLLEISDQNGITASYNASIGILSLSGSASLADYGTALGVLLIQIIA